MQISLIIFGTELPIIDNIILYKDFFVLSENDSQ